MSLHSQYKPTVSEKIPQEIENLANKINDPKSFTSSFLSIRKFSNGKYGIMITFRRNNECKEGCEGDCECEISKQTLKDANPELIPNFLKIDEVRGRNCIDVMFITI